MNTTIHNSERWYVEPAFKHHGVLVERMEREAYPPRKPQYRVWLKSGFTIVPTQRDARDIIDASSAR